jgi:hypothetical protein
VLFIRGAMFLGLAFHCKMYERSPLFASILAVGESFQGYKFLCLYTQGFAALQPGLESANRFDVLLCD